MDATNLYTPITPQRIIDITSLYTIHYQENHKNYYFTGEKHNFWELMYVERGELILDCDRVPAPIHLERGELILFRPGEFHRIYSNNISSHIVMIASFQCHSPAMEFFMNHNHFHANDQIRQQMGILLHEARKCFTENSLYTSTMSVQRKDTPAPGSEQILVMILEWLLIQLIRNDYMDDQGASQQKGNYIDSAVSYMKQNLRSKITLKDICEHVNISESQLQKAFQQRMGISVMRYLVQQRMEEAKFLICIGDKSFTQIAEEFGYSSVHHFSTQFRKTVGMSPTEYAASISAASRIGMDILTPPMPMVQNSRHRSK